MNNLKTNHYIYNLNELTDFMTNKNLIFILWNKNYLESI